MICWPGLLTVPDLCSQALDQAVSRDKKKPRLNLPRLKNGETLTNLACPRGSPYDRRATPGKFRSLGQIRIAPSRGAISFTSWRAGRARVGDSPSCGARAG